MSTQPHQDESVRLAAVPRWEQSQPRLAPTIRSFNSTHPVVSVGIKEPCASVAAIEFCVRQVEPVARVRSNHKQSNCARIPARSGQLVAAITTNHHDPAQESGARNFHVLHRVGALVSTANGASVPIIVDRLILSCAEFLVDVYGENDAMRVASRRFDLYAVKPDFFRCAMWQQIMCALWELRRTGRADDEQVH